MLEVVKRESYGTSNGGRSFRSLVKGGATAEAYGPVGAVLMGSGCTLVAYWSTSVRLQRKKPRWRWELGGNLKVLYSIGVDTS